MNEIESFLQFGQILYLTRDVIKQSGFGGDIHATLDDYTNQRLQIYVENKNRNGIIPVDVLTADGVRLIIAASKHACPEAMVEHFDRPDITIRPCESEQSTNIRNAFPGEQIVLQYTIDYHNIDLYFPEYKLVVRAGQQHDVPPNSKYTILYMSRGDNIFVLIGKIYTHINNYKRRMTREHATSPYPDTSTSTARRSIISQSDH